MRKYLLVLCLGLIFIGGKAFAHGNATPQPIDSSSLPDIGEEWLESNPYRGNAEAIKVGKSGYNSNCARCHGLGAISGGIAPDLRELDEGDEWFIYRIRNGATRNGVTYMPHFEGIFDQKAMWSIRSWLETVPTDD